MPPKSDRANALQRKTSKRKTSSAKLPPKPVTARTSTDAVVAGVKITHPDRILYADAGITKLDLARYYEQVEDWILPHVTNRPLTIVRCPEGQGSQCFYQKHWTESLPESVHSVLVKEKDASEKYIFIKDIAGLVSLVQMGVLEFHPWSSRADKLERPDRLVFDLDPGVGVAWSAIIQGAKDIRGRLTDMGLESFLRTSGGNGLHVVAPLARRNTWDEIKQFAKSIANSLVRDHPHRYVATMSKAKRRGKVFIDYLRNQRGATAIASYSTRSRPGAPVATPLDWNELNNRLRPNRYTVKSLPKRLAMIQADPWPDFFMCSQSLTTEMLREAE